MGEHEIYDQVICEQNRRIEEMEDLLIEIYEWCMDKQHDWSVWKERVRDIIGDMPENAGGNDG